MTDRLSVTGGHGQQSDSNPGSQKPGAVPDRLAQTSDDTSATLPFLRLAYPEIPSEIPSKIPSDRPVDSASAGASVLPPWPTFLDDDLSEDLSDDFDHDGDTVIAVPDEDDEPPLPPASPSAALVIRAPAGPLPLKPNFTIAAVVVTGQDEEGEDTISDFQFLTVPLQTARMAIGVANYRATRPQTLKIPATHILVNDHTGKEVHRATVYRAA